MLGDSALPGGHLTLPATGRHARAQELPADRSASWRIGVVFLAVAEADLLPVAAGNRVTWRRCGNVQDCRDEEQQSRAGPTHSKQTKYTRPRKKFAIHRSISRGVRVPGL